MDQNLSVFNFDLAYIVFYRWTQDAGQSK